MLPINLDLTTNGCSSEHVQNGILSNSYIIKISIERKLQMLNESSRNANSVLGANST
jgi:hypothetical protein